ncbi:MAG: chromate transporter [Ruminococcus sp.]|nr:chromate transporter [Ruminococcus sp.]
MILLDLFLGFLKVGCFSFGGAYGAVPLIREVVMKYGWMNDDEIAYMVAVSESTPGPIMINLATFTGSSEAGIIGALIATFAVVLPSFIVIILLTIALKNLLKNKYTQAAMNGLTASVIGIISATGIYMILSNTGINASVGFDMKALILTVVLSAVMFGYKPLTKKNLSPFVFIIVSAVCGILIF